MLTGIVVDMKHSRDGSSIARIFVTPEASAESMSAFPALLNHSLDKGSELT